MMASTWSSSAGRDDSHVVPEGRQGNPSQQALATYCSPAAGSQTLKGNVLDNINEKSLHKKMLLIATLNISAFLKREVEKRYHRPGGTRWVSLDLTRTNRPR
jgi:hypothetical protein